MSTQTGMTNMDMKLNRLRIRKAELAIQLWSSHWRQCTSESPCKDRRPSCDWNDVRLSQEIEALRKEIRANIGRPSG